MAKSPKEKPAGFWKGLIGAFTELPTQTKLAGYFPLTFIAVLWVLPADVLKQNAWLTLLGVILPLIGYYALAVVLHRPERTSADPDRPPYTILDGDILRSLAAQPILFPLILNPAANVLRAEIQRQVERVKKRQVKNSHADVFKEIQKMTGVQDRVILDALITWAKHRP